MSRISASFFIISFFIFFKINAQGIDNLASYSQKYPQEKVYLHCDKATYAPGETVWFKAYILEGLLPAEESKTFYIDWIDEKGNVLYHSVAPLIGGTTNGQFDIPDTYKGALIHIKAYTKWMLNFDTAFIYHKTFRILSKNNLAASKTVFTISAQFFPEGGDLIAGVMNKIAFKANDQFGYPASIKGVIQDATGRFVDSFKTVHNGLGFVNLQPKADVDYTAKWKDANGKEATAALPKAKSEGVSLQLKIEGTKRLYFINRTATASANLQQLYLVGTVQQQLAFKKPIDLTSITNAKGIIPTESLPTGILTITVFDAQWNAVAERITFVNNREYNFEPGFNVLHWGLNKRARNEIEIKVPDSMVANLSIAITDAGIEKDTGNTIISQLLLSGDLRGYIHNASYYFSDNSDIITQHLDLLMLTHGWRRFKWEDVINNKFPKLTYPKDSTYLVLSGKILGPSPSQLSSSGGIITVIKSKDSTSLLVMPVEASGKFEDPSLIFFDTLRVYHQLPKKGFTNATVQFMTDRLPAPNYVAAVKKFPVNSFSDTVGSYRHLALAEELQKQIEQAKGKLLENVTIVSKTKSPTQVLDEKYTSGLFQSGDAIQFDLVNNPVNGYYSNVFEYLQGKVAGLIITGGGSNMNLEWRGGSPSVLIDEMPTDLSLLSSIPVADIAYVKVFRPPFMGVSGGGNGAIAIYTRKGSDIASAPGKGLSASTILGYTPIKQFYSPNYSRVDPQHDQRDIRTTIYWNPQVNFTSKKSRNVLVFYNNDVSKAFRVIIEGMTNDGRLTHYEYVME